MEPNQTIQPTTQEQPIKKNKLPKWLATVTPFSKLLAMSLFILFPFIGFYLGMQYQKILMGNSPIASEINKSKALEPTIIQTNTTNWKTFTSTTSGYSFKYPNDWTEQKSDEINETEAFLTAPPDPECPQCGGGLNGVNASIRQNPKNMSLINFIENELKYGNFANDKINSSRLNTTVMIDRDPPGAGSGQEALIAHRQKVIDFYCGSCTNEFMDQILSTVHLTN